jgi:predicted O-methyltransferase YrrM
LTNLATVHYRVFLTAVELNLFGLLTAPQSARQLSERAGTHALLTQKLLDVLVAMDFVVKTHEGYCNTEETTAFLTDGGAYFSAGSVDYLKGNYELFDALTDRITQGPKKVEKKKHTYKPETIRMMANTCLLGRLQEIIGIVTGLPRFNEARRLLDIGGAHGLFAIALCQEHPQLSAVVFDQPGVTDITSEYIIAHRMQNRICTITGDHGVDRFGDGFDLVFESFTFFGNKARLADYFARIHHALAPGGLLVSVRSVLEDDRQGPASALLWDLKNALNGGEEIYHTRSELFSILGEVGFSGIHFAGDQQRSPGDYQIIAAGKP